MYKVEISRKAAKEIKKLPKQIIPAVVQKIEALGENPRPAGCKKLVGYKNLWRIRQGVYRIIYAIEEQPKIVEIRKVSHRGDAYE